MPLFLLRFVPVLHAAAVLDSRATRPPPPTMLRDDALDAPVRVLHTTKLCHATIGRRRREAEVGFAPLT